MIRLIASSNKDKLLPSTKYFLEVIQSWSLNQYSYDKHGVSGAMDKHGASGAKHKQGKSCGWSQ